METTLPRQRHDATHARKYLLAALFVVVMTVLFADVRYTGSDAQGTFLLSESLLGRGTVKLDHFGEETLASYGYKVHVKNGHYYYYFPVGTSIASIPFVAAARLAGIDVQSREPELQILIAAFCAAMLVLLFFRLACLFLGPKQALVLALVYWFGSSLASTGATALWSHDFAALFALLAIWLSIRVIVHRDWTMWVSPAIALALFMAYLCRPTLSLLAPLLLLFLFSYRKGFALATGAAFGALFLCFMLFSLREFNQFLPDYYLPGRLETEDFSRALWGNLASPSRGLFVYSPFILVLALRMCLGKGRIQLKNTWLLIGVAWPLLHLVIISRFPHWWGGWSYGPRFMTDVMPGLFLLGVNGWPSGSASPGERITRGALVLTALFAVYANTVQGLFNGYSARWNAEPNINFFPHYLFDWRYPQFLHSEERHARRLLAHEEKMNLDHPVVAIGPDGGDPVEYSGWEAGGESLRWNRSAAPALTFRVSNEDSFEGELVIDAGYPGYVVVEVWLNGVKLDEYLAAKNDLPRTVTFDPSLLRHRAENVLTFRFYKPKVGEAENGRAFALRKVILK